jgi:hypothetical protein
MVILPTLATGVGERRGKVKLEAGVENPSPAFALGKDEREGEGKTEASCLS